MKDDVRIVGVFDEVENRDFPTKFNDSKWRISYLMIAQFYYKLLHRKLLKSYIMIF